MTRTRVWRVALAALTCVGLTQGVAAAADPLRITKPVRATTADLDPLRTWAAPYLLVHPKDPNILIAGMHEFRDKTCGVMRSMDRGATWKLVEGVANPPSYPYCLANNSNIFQAPLAFGRSGTLYMAMVAWDTPDTRSKASIAVARSDDLGDTWSSVIVHDARPTADPDQVSLRPVTGLAVDTKTGDADVVYVSYRLQYQNQPTGKGRPVEPYLGVSTDGGRSFTTTSALAGTFDSEGTRQRMLSAATTAVPNPTATTTTAPAGSFGAEPLNKMNFGASTNGHGLAVDNKGNVYIAWASQTVNNVTTGNQPRGQFVSKSTDRGRTFTVTQVADFSVKNRGNSRIAWGPGGGPNGTLHLVFEQSARPEVANYSDVVYSRSTDGGATWSEPRSLTDDDPALLNGKYIPNVTVAPNGRVDVSWWDTRDDPGIRSNDVYYTYSTDNGQTWSKNIRVTDQTIDRRFGVWGNNFDQNSPPSMVSTKEYTLFGWDDTRLSRGDDGPVLAADPTTATEGIGGGVQDVFLSAVQFKAIGGGASSAAKAVLAGVVGLVAVGLVLLLVVGIGRGSSGGSSPGRTKAGTAGKEPAGVA